MHVLFFAYILDVAANVNELPIPWTLKPDILPCCLQSVLLRVGRTQISLPLPFCSLLPNSRNMDISGAASPKCISLMFLC